MTDRDGRANVKKMAQASDDGSHPASDFRRRVILPRTACILNRTFPASQPAVKVVVAAAIRDSSAGGIASMTIKYALPPIPLFQLEPLEPRRTLSAGFFDPSFSSGASIKLEDANPQVDYSEMHALM